MLAFGACALLALAAGDSASLGAVIGLVIGFGVAQLGAIRGRQGAISIIVTAWILVALIIGVTLFALFGADPVSARLSGFFSGLGSNMIIGQGFGSSGQSISSGLAAGLGVLGVALGVLVAFATLFQTLLSERRSQNGVDFTIAIWFATLGAILVAPAEVALFGPVCILFAASAFSISLSSVPMPRHRRALLDPPSRQRIGPRRPIRTGAIRRDSGLDARR